MNVISFSLKILCYTEVKAFPFLTKHLSLTLALTLAVWSATVRLAWISFSVQFSSVAQSCPTLCDPMNRSTPGLPGHHLLPEFIQTDVHRVSDSIQPSHPLSSPSPAAPNPSQHQGLFQWVNSSHEVPRYWSFSFSISPYSEHPGLISFRMDWLDLLAVQGTLKSLLQHHSSKASILWCSAFFTVQLSHPYMTTGKTIVLTRWTFVGKAMPLLFNMPSRLVITFLPRSKHLLISWLQSLSAVILETQKSLTLFPHLFPMKWYNMRISFYFSTNSQAEYSLFQ